MLDSLFAEARMRVRAAGARLATARAEAANAQLVLIERRVLELVGVGHLDEAADLLDGDDYALQKEIYAAGVRPRSLPPPSCCSRKSRSRSRPAPTSRKSATPPCAGRR